MVTHQSLDQDLCRRTGQSCTRAGRIDAGVSVPECVRPIHTRILPEAKKSLFLDVIESCYELDFTRKQTAKNGGFVQTLDQRTLKTLDRPTSKTYEDCQISLKLSEKGKTVSYNLCKLTKNQRLELWFDGDKTACRRRFVVCIFDFVIQIIHNHASESMP